MNQMKGFKIIILFFIVAAVTAMLFSCSKGDALGLEGSLYKQSPYGRWKLEGYGSKDSEIKKIVFSTHSKAYFLTLNADGTFIGTSSTNEIHGIFTIHPPRHTISFSQTDFYNTNKIPETDEGNVYLTRLLRVYKYEHKVSSDQLHLYYSDKEYLLFIKPVN